MQANKTELFGALCGLGGTITEAMNEIPGFVPCGHPAAVVLEALALCGDDTASAEAIAEQTEVVRGFIEHVSEHRGVSAHAGRKAPLGAAEQKVADKLIDDAITADAADPDQAQSFYRALAALEA